MSASRTGTLIVVDGIEQLGRADRWWLRHHTMKKNKFILATSHHDLTGFTTLYSTAVSRPLVQHLSQRLVQDSHHRIAQIVDEAIDNREITPGTNVRNLWFDLYDIVATQA